MLEKVPDEGAGRGVLRDLPSEFEGWGSYHRKLGEVFLLWFTKEKGMGRGSVTPVGWGGE